MVLSNHFELSCTLNKIFGAEKLDLYLLIKVALMLLQYNIIPMQGGTTRISNGGTIMIIPINIKMVVANTKTDQINTKESIFRIENDDRRVSDSTK